MTRARRESGLSLLELLVAMTILSLVVALAAGGLSFGRAAWERGADLGGARIEERAARKALARLVAGAEIIRLRDGTRTPRVLFDGGSDRLAFPAPPPTRLAATGLQYVQLERSPDGALTLAWTAIGATRPRIDGSAAREAVVDGVEALAFRYWGVGPEGEPAAWRSEWRGRTTLPEMVEIRLRAGGRDWPPIRAWARAGGEREGTG